MIHKSIVSEVGVRAVETRPVMPSKQLMPDPIVKFRKEKLIQFLNQPNNQSSLTPLIQESVIDINYDTLVDKEGGELIETTTKFEFNLGFAKVGRSIKKIKND